MMKGNKGKNQKKVVEASSEEDQEELGISNKAGRKSYKKSSNQTSQVSAQKRKNSSDSEEQMDSGKKPKGGRQKKEAKDPKKPKGMEEESKPAKRNTKGAKNKDVSEDEENEEKGKPKSGKKEKKAVPVAKARMEIESVGSASEEEELYKKKSSARGQQKKRKILEETTEEEKGSEEEELKPNQKKKSSNKMEILSEEPAENEADVASKGKNADAIAKGKSADAIAKGKSADAIAKGKRDADVIPKGKNEAAAEVIEKGKKETAKAQESKLQKKGNEKATANEGKTKPQTGKAKADSGKKSRNKGKNDDEEEEDEYVPDSEFEKSESEASEIDNFDEDFEDIKDKQAKKRSTKKLKKETPKQENSAKSAAGKGISVAIGSSTKKMETKAKAGSSAKGKNAKLLDSDGEKGDEKSDFGADFMKAFENADPETLKFSVNEADPLPEWLMPETVRDAKMRLRSDPDYDPSTVYIPKELEVAFSPMFQQYWQIKRHIFDTILFLKFGNCYMMFYEDALIVRKELDLKLCFWGAKRPCVTVMDTTLKKHSAKLIERGYKVSIAEQMEKDLNKEGSIIKREIVQILSKGTITDYDQGYASKFMLALAEEGNKVGVCIVDTTTHQFYSDQFEDDDQRNNLRSMLSRVQPVEVIYSQKMMHPSTQTLIKATVHPAPVFTRLQIDEIPNGFSVLNEIKKVFLKNKVAEKVPMPKEEKNEESDSEEENSGSQKDSQKEASPDSEGEKEEQQVEINEEDLEDYPQFFKDIEEKFIDEKRVELNKKSSCKSKEGEGESPIEDLRSYHLDVEKRLSVFYLLQAVNLSLIYLSKTLLRDTVFRMGIFQSYNYSLQRETCLYMNAQTLDNLEVFKTNSVGVYSRVTTKNTLFDFVDRTKTAFGKRLLRKWMEFPLRDMETLNDRLDAVEDLLKYGNVVDYFQKEVSKLPDLERIISSVYNSRNKYRLQTSEFSHFAMDRLKMFLTLLKDLEKVEEIIQTFNENKSGFKSKRLLKLITFKRVDKGQEQSGRKRQAKEEGLFPKISDLISDLSDMVVLKDKLAIPAPGINKRYDKISEELDVIKRNLNEILESMKKKLKSQEITFQHVRQRYELEVPEKVMSKLDPADYKLTLTSKKKGYLRYHTSGIEDNVLKLKSLEEDLHKCLVPFIVDYFMKFYNRNQYWIQIIACLAELDCLCSLATASLEMGDVRCRPKFTTKENCLVIKQLYHPCLMRTGLELVPNDTIFDDSTDVLLVTGPNMGGKSTLLRQVCLAVILAQIGSFVPAKEMRLSLRDKIFSRIGASDSLLEGKSTFFVEMEETHSIMTSATSDSLVIIDELGRGTSTYDGVAIAHSVLKYISDQLKCKTLFATHYHLLLDEFRLFSNVKNYYMSFLYNEEKEKITFLYKFIPGEASRSFGINVAKIVGLPQDVIEIAKEKSHRMTLENEKLVHFGNAIKNFNNIVNWIEKFDAKDELDDMLETLKLI